jgi:phage FluMu protein gp41
MEHKIKLLTGYTDNKKVTHQDVTIGKRVTVGDLMLLDQDPRGSSVTQYNDLVMARMITAFGELKMPLALSVLLSLDEVDREDLQRAGHEFNQMTAGEITPEYGEDHSVRLAFGFKIGEDEYNRVSFGRMLTGHDHVEADRQELAGVSRECFLLGRQITKIRTDNEAVTLDGPVELESFKTLDGMSLQLLRVGAVMYRTSFRFEREALSREARKDSADPDEGNGNDGGGDPKSSTGAN